MRKQNGKETFSKVQEPSNSVAELLKALTTGAGARQMAQARIPKNSSARLTPDVFRWLWRRNSRTTTHPQIVFTRLRKFILRNWRAVSPSPGLNWQPKRKCRI